MTCCMLSPPVPARWVSASASRLPRACSSFITCIGHGRHSRRVTQARASGHATPAAPVAGFPRIAIVGAGLGGLTLARVLLMHGVHAAVYDLDPHANARNQGGTLDIHAESGPRARAEAGLLDAFRTLVRPGGAAMRIFNSDGTLLLDDSGAGGPGERPEVDRTALRSLLLSSLPPGTVQWGAKVSSVRRCMTSGTHELTFATSHSATADVVIGADGAWSRVRPLVSDATPVYSGLSCVEGRLADADAKHPLSAALVGTGSMFALAEGKGLIAQRNADGSLRVYACLMTPSDWSVSPEIKSRDADDMHSDLFQRFASWAPSLTRLIRDSDHLVARAVHALPVGHRWDRVPGVTLLGDAAHLMSPFAGEGANLAMLDGAELALSILAHPGDMEAALGGYEAVMFPRAAAAAAESAASMAMCFGPGAPQGFLDFMASHGPPAEGEGH